MCDINDLSNDNHRNSFAGTLSLKCLKIDENGLKNFANIQRLTKIQHLFANSNRINDFPDIDRLTDLTNLKELELISNPINRRPGYRQGVIKKLPNLLYLDGKVIAHYHEELETHLAFL